ncbi:RidA family protein [Chromobacterium violaceum]|uniref:RidA family protein n=1 Tax=Chromobacterium violaceum TaxID=536 RepID=UPI001CE10104|nr:RidA family protein [Chromobacterium violaceum]
MKHLAVAPGRAAMTLSNPAGLYDPAPNGYSHLGVVAPGCRLVFVAGQGGETEDGKLPPDFADQTRQAFANLCVALAAAGAEPGDVVKLTVLIVDHDESRLRILGEALDRVWGEAMKPTCTLIPVPRLALDGMLFEVEALAALPA